MDEGGTEGERALGKAVVYSQARWMVLFKRSEQCHGCDVTMVPANSTVLI